MEPYKGSFHVNGKTIFWQTSFDKNFRFKCTDCGLCCGFNNVTLQPNELLQIRNALTTDDFSEEFADKEGIKRTRIKGTNTGNCMFWKEKKCSIYSNRPNPCKLYPFKIIPYTDNTFFIDFTYECPAILNNEQEKENTVDFNSLVKEYYTYFSKQGVGSFSYSELKKQLNVKKLETEQKWKEIVFLLKNCNNLFDYYDTICNLSVSKNNIMINNSECNNNQNIMGDYDLIKIKIGNKRAFDGELYCVLSHDQKILFKYDNGKEITLNKVSKKIITINGKEYLQHYFSKMWERKKLETDLLGLLKQIRDEGYNITYFDLMLELFKNRLYGLQFLLDVIAEKNKHNHIEANDIKEALLCWDLGFMNIAD